MPWLSQTAGLHHVIMPLERGCEDKISVCRCWDGVAGQGIERDLAHVCFSDLCPKISGSERLTIECGRRGWFPERLIVIINDHDEEAEVEKDPASKSHNKNIRPSLDDRIRSGGASRFS